MVRRGCLTAVIIVAGIIGIVGLFVHSVWLSESEPTKIPAHVDFIVIGGPAHECYVIQDARDVQRITSSLTRVSEHLLEGDWKYSLEFINHGVESYDLPIDKYGYPDRAYWRITKLMDRNHRRFWRVFEVDSSTDLEAMKAWLRKQGYLVYFYPLGDLSQAQSTIRLSYVHRGRKSDQSKMEKATLGSLPGDKWVKPITRKLDKVNPGYQILAPEVAMIRSFPNSDMADYEREIIIYPNGEIPSTTVEEIESIWKKNATRGTFYNDIPKPCRFCVISKHPFDGRDIRARFKAVE